MLRINRNNVEQPLFNFTKKRGKRVFLLVTSKIIIKVKFPLYFSTKINNQKIFKEIEIL